MSMNEWLAHITEYAIFILNLMALVIIAFGATEAFIAGCRAMFGAAHSGLALRNGYMRFARWLVAGMTFQLAADVIETTITPGWEDIGRMAAIAAIRTFLSFFLERDMKEVAELTSSTSELTRPYKEKGVKTP